ncbi:MAG: hypothetical protein LBT39_02675 [Treponema sp.]|jgi:hypothetical protein|nr:hypothetical protein [Treponema sp.]
MRFLLLPLVFCSVVLGALDLEELGIGDVGAELSVKPEYSRNMGFCYEFALIGKAEFKESLLARGGIALGQTGKEFDLDLFLDAGYRLPLPLSIDLSVHFEYLYNTIPEYLYQVNSLFPYLSYRNKWIGADLGSTLRFTTFDSELISFEPILSVRLFVNVFNLEQFNLLIGAGNFSTFSLGNLGAYYLFMKSQFNFDERQEWIYGSPLVSLISTVNLYQTGSIGLTSTLQSISWEWGVCFSW